MWYKLYLLTGLILLAISLTLLKQSIDYIGRSERAIGTVVSMELSDGAYSPVFEIKVKKHPPVVYELPASSNPPSWHIGEQATFLYDTEKPDEVRMMSYFWIFSWTIVLMAIAIPLLIIGGGYFFLQPRIEKVNESYF
ncbi:MAG: hypothetical protein J7623_22675 [Chitinophaga sp.]|uniref:hypothetical protein n=1 Tax=Chitinophaga sp. TaxID=1869181 RepID=UPI001B0E19E5|nr:hypothetical protein [Chitinophaga sp.]MBO9731463.1 hypothetical protein [Chitinophaga sp.]